jgi:hypothetical protein
MPGEIITIDDLNQVLNTKATNIFYDIEDTIFRSNVFYEMIGETEYYKIFLDLCKDVKIFDVMYIGKNFKRELMQNDIPQIIYKLRNMGKKIFALTSGYPSHQKKIRIKEYGIRFDGYLFTKRAEKGDFLFNFLTLNKVHGNCCFIDNHIEKIVSVQDAFNKYFFQDSQYGNKKIDLYLYKKTYKNKATKEDFIKYWNEVIEAVKNNAVGELKAFTQVEKERKIQYKNKLLNNALKEKAHNHNKEKNILNMEEILDENELEEDGEDIL